MKIMPIGQVEEVKEAGALSKFTVVTTMVALLLAFTSSMTISQMGRNCLVRSK